MPVVQIATFPVSDAFVSNPDIFKAPLGLIKSAEGHQSSFYGLKVEDQKTGYYVSVWETYEHREKFAKNPSYASLIEQLKPAVSGQFVRDHITVTGNPHAALSSPAVEFAAFTLKADGSAEKLSSVFEELAIGLDAAAGAHPPCVWGRSIENPNKFFMIVGWDSVEAHLEIARGGSLHSFVEQIKAVADISIAHSGLKKHQG